jgi:Rps23 Pro-64 3,4-dihydroxylase Tpa1-like proline 4-hydroxylase
MFEKLIQYRRNEYQKQGTSMIPFDEKINPFTDEDFQNLFKYCEKVEKEFIEVGDAGEDNNLMVGRFMTDKAKPEVVENPYSQKLLKILRKNNLIDLVKKILNINNEIHLRRVQFNQINKGNFVGYHLDTDSNPDYLAACVLQLGDDFEGGIYRVFQEDKSYNDFNPTKGSLIISNCNYPHEVTKVISGKRKSLVFFISNHFGDNKRYS